MKTQPAYRIDVDGQSITAAVRPRLISLQLTDVAGLEADQLSLTLSDHDGRLAIPPRGASIRLAIGWREPGGPEALTDRGTYTVDDVEHSGAPDQLTIRARSADLRDSLPGKHSESWHDMTLGDIVDAIAALNGLTPAVADRLSGIHIPHLDQTDESDMHFLTRLGERYDAIAAIKDGRLLFLPRGQGLTATGTPIPTITLSRSQGDQHRYLATDRDSYTGVIAHWYDAETARRHEVLAGDRDRVQQLRGEYATEAEATDAAHAALRRMGREGQSFSVTLARGRADLLPETPVRARGWKPDIDATPWVITQIRHSIDDSGFVSQIDMEHQGD